MNRKPPISCIPCRVTYRDVRYQIEKNGEVRKYQPAVDDVGANFPLPESEAKLVRREASRQRRNRNARERAQAMKDLGMVRAKGGAFGGWE